MARARARDNPTAVVDALGPLIGEGTGADLPMMTSLGWWPILIAATIESGDLGGAVSQIDRLEDAAGARRLDLRARVAGLRARAAAADGEPEEATVRFEEALDLLGPEDPQLDAALIHRSFGMLLAARGKRRAAVDQRRAARLVLSRLGAATISIGSTPTSPPSASALPET